MSEKIEYEKAIEHPMEEILGIEPGTTIIERTEIKTDLVVAEDYDNKDAEIEGQFQEIYDAAMSSYTQSDEDSEIIDPKYRARNGEVSVQFLKTALDAASKKFDIKQHKDKLKTGPSGPGDGKGPLVVDRNELLKLLGAEDATNKEKVINEPIEGEFVDHEADGS